MKQFLFCIILLALLTACSGASSQGGTHECNKHEGVCIYIKAEEPIVGGEPISVTVTVKGDKDIPDLGIALSSTGNVHFEDPNLKTWKKTEIAWKVNLKADKPHISKHNVLFPSEDGFYYVVASAFTSDYGEVASNSMRISIAGNEGKVYYSGTKVPGSEGTIIVPVTVIPGFSQTPTPTPTLETVTPSYP